VRACPLCGGRLRPSGVSAYDRLVTGEGPFTISECPACEYGVTDADGLELERYYGGAYFDGFYEDARDGALVALRARYRRRAAARRYSRPPFAIAGPGRVLDVGCGAGDLLAHYSGLGWSAFGIEPESAVAAIARGRGAEVHEGTLADHPWQPGSFELVVFSHSLEHIREPLEALRAARELLTEGGLIAIHAPNWRCWQRGVFRGRWFHLDLPRHVQHFSPRALSVAADRLELELEGLGTDATLISVAYSLHYLLAGHWRPGWRLWLAYLLALGLAPPVAIVNRRRGADCCWALLRRGRS
jgi:SAM-dependent methyltransferase